MERTGEEKGAVISGGHIDERFALSFLAREDLLDQDVCAGIIAADAGLCFCEKNRIVPAHIVGDFDSAGKKAWERWKDRPGVELKRYRPEKDWTDTEIAVELGLSLGWKKLYILGGTGTRLDHVLGNIQVLALALEKGCEAVLLDEYNRVTLHKSPFSLEKARQWGRYVSFFAYGGEVEALTLRGFAYEVEDFRLGTVGSRAVSNELREETGRVSFRGGRLLCIESRD